MNAAGLYLDRKWADTWIESRLKYDDTLYGSTGLSFLLLAGTGTVSFESGEVVDVSTGESVASGSALIANHRYLVAEDTTAYFTINSKTAVVNYMGQYGLIPSDAVDYNAMAYALKKVNLFRGSATGYGSGFDLEVPPTRLQALIMFIRVLGEEEEALAWNGTQPFLDIHEGTQAFHYVGYAYEKGYTNGYTKTEFRPAGAVNAWQYSEFMLRAMGYSSAANTNIGDALTRAQDAGMLTQGEGAYLQAETFLRAELVYISYCALQTYLPDSSLTLADQLQMKGIFSPAEWAAALASVPGPRL